MVENKITEYTRQDIVDLLTSGYYDKRMIRKYNTFGVEDLMKFHSCRDCIIYSK